jgi:hypothetical protein
LQSIAWQSDSVGDPEGGSAVSDPLLDRSMQKSGFNPNGPFLITRRRFRIAISRLKATRMKEKKN